MAAVVSGAADSAVVDSGLECPEVLEAGSPAAGSGARAGEVDTGEVDAGQVDAGDGGPEEDAGDGGAAGDGAFLLRPG